jgi:catechol 2,3-dioxygenase-like lactoylglutathione lyase family enzyme
MFKRIDHVEIIPSDVDKTMNFYVDVFGFKIKMRKKMDTPPLKEIIYMEMGDSVIELLRVDGPSPKPPEPWIVGYRMMAIEVEDMDETVEYLKQKGIEITKGPVVSGTSKRAEIRDLDGIPIELRQW